MNLVEVSFHNVARAELEQHKAKHGGTYWTTLTCFNSEGSIIGETVVFSSASAPLKLTSPESERSFRLAAALRKVSEIGGIRKQLGSSHCDAIDSLLGECKAPA